MVFELAVNPKTAEALGLTVPLMLLARTADVSFFMLRCVEASWSITPEMAGCATTAVQDYCFASDSENSPLRTRVGRFSTNLPTASSP